MRGEYGGLASVLILAPTVVYVNSHGDLNPDGSPMLPRHVILTRLEMKRGGWWLIVLSQATNIVPRATARASREANRDSGQ
jgi:hypothetical protein